MKIVHVFSSFDWGGMSNYMKSLLSQMKSDIDLEHIILQNDLSTLNSGDKLRIDESYDFLGLKTYKLKNINKYKNILLDCHNHEVEDLFEEFIQEQDIDIMHFHQIFEIPYSLVQIAYLRGCITFISFHDAGGLCPKYHLVTEEGKECIGSLDGLNCQKCFNKQSVLEMIGRYNYVSNVLNKYCDVRIAVSEYIKNLYSLSFIHEKIEVIRTGTDIGRKKTMKEIGNCIQIFYGGGTNYQKGLLILLEALKGIDSSKYILNIYGSVHKQIKSKINKSYCNISINFQDKYEYQDTYKVLDKNDLAVIPSIGSECAPLILQELLARKIPTIISTAGGMMEYVSGVSGVKVFKKGSSSELNKILYELISCPEKLQQMSESIDNDRLRTFENIAQEYSKIYKKSFELKRHFRIEPVDKEYVRNCNLKTMRYTKQDLDEDIGVMVSRLNNKFKNTVDIFIFGTGEFSDYVLKYLDSYKFNVKGYFDNNSEVQGSKKNSLEIIKPKYINNIKVIIASSWTEEIYSQLLLLGYEQEDIIKLDKIDLNI